MRCHIIVSLESIECVESHRWPNKTPAQNCVSTGRQKDCPIAATLKRKLLTKGKFSDRQNAIVALSILSDLMLRRRVSAVSKDEWHQRGAWFETALRASSP